MATKTTSRSNGDGAPARSGLSIVVPVFNESAGLAQFHERLSEVVQKLRRGRGLAC